MVQTPGFVLERYLLVKDEERGRSTFPRMSSSVLVFPNWTLAERELA